MKTVNAICVYKESTNQIYNLTVVNTDGLHCSLIRYRNDTNEPEPYKYNTFQEMHKAILSIAKENGFLIDCYAEFGAKVYFISFIDIDNPENIARKYYKEIENRGQK